MGVIAMREVVVRDWDELQRAVWEAVGGTRRRVWSVIGTNSNGTGCGPPHPAQGRTV